MSTYDERIQFAIANTVVMRPPRQQLATFGNTNISYYLVSEPAYRDLVRGEQETVIREGRVLAERPRVVTPTYLINIEGFSEHARRYIELVQQEQGPNIPGLFYGYRNEFKELNIVSSDIASVVHKLEERINSEGNPLSAIIKGIDELWDVSLLKFIFEMTEFSLGNNVSELRRRGLLEVDSSGVPMDARVNIERLFALVMKGELDPSTLKLELERWGLFEEYEDRFLRLFKR
ncbi:MAG: hypothetical protein IBX68_07865 [Dehalococcoidia bacterium]|nr:hypothetical protein [Dehalococcoidia bacterium]